MGRTEKPLPLSHAPIDAVTAPSAGPGEDSVHVTHNRKQHLAPEPDAAPRKATPTDFLTTATTNDAPALPVEVAGAPSAAITVKTTRPAVSTVPVRALDAKLKPESIPDLKIPAVVMPALYTKSGRLIVPPALKGSHEILLHQNEMADSDGLDRIQDDDDLDRMRVSKLLVAIPSIAGIQSDERLPSNRRYCRPWTAQFLTALARAHYARFHTALQVNSAVRTVEFQQRLIRTNGNAAPAGGETASPHLTGQAIDLAKHGLSMTEIAWLRGYLLPLVQQGKVDVEEEFQQACFHISVYKKYVPQPEPKREIATAHRTPASALATAMR